MVAEIVEKFGIEPRSAVNYLKENWSVIKNLNKVWDAMDAIKQIDNLKIVEIDGQILHDAVMLSKVYCLLSNDAIHVATMKKHGILNIATNDSDF